ncbi:MAG: hypothetical protein HYR72_26985 [Deltaproteobacteria bacterium]|nr:hypothetical protein [Deltaproteobacteria bacterium]MBI3390340.1 hypothetical protein [Deltaproteobacteria bacterium]
MKRTLAFLIPLVVAGMALWVSELGGKDVILGALKSWGPLGQTGKISTTSPTRPGAASFFAGEPIRFSLRDVESERVLWFFREQDVYPASIEAEYAFPFDDQRPAGVMCVYRVDAFFKTAGDYATTSTFVHVENRKLVASAVVRPSEIVVSAEPTFADAGGKEGSNDTWEFRRASLGKLEDGRFKPIFFDLPITQRTEKEVTFAITDNDLARTGYSVQGLSPDRNVSVWFEFFSKGQLLTVVKRLPAIAGLQ